MFVRYLLVLCMLLAYTHSTAQNVKRFSCRIEYPAENRIEDGYQLERYKTTDGQTSLWIHHAHTHPRINPKHIIYYTPQGVGTWSEVGQGMQPVRVGYLRKKRCWLITIDSALVVIHISKKAHQ